MCWFGDGAFPGDADWDADAVEPHPVAKPTATAIAVRTTTER